jgi:hypothetical protein
MEWVTATFFLVGVVSIATAVLPWLASLFFFRQSLKKRYNASWALVTGERGRARAQMGDCWSALCPLWTNNSFARAHTSTLTLTPFPLPPSPP